MEQSSGIVDRAVFLGLDCSTQSLKAIALEYNEKENTLELLAEESINYDTELPHYQTSGGAIRGDDGVTVTAPSIMFVEALEKLFAKLHSSNFPFDRVTAISASGQQHGSIYWRRGSSEILRKASALAPLATQLKDAFAIPNGPIWMDSSTTSLCAELEKHMGGPLSLAQVTGSRAYERFTASQIAKNVRNQPEAYENTERISLISSFIVTLLVGDYASIDASDGSGMNLMNIYTLDWDDRALNFADPNGRLRDKLGPIAASYSPAGYIAQYFVSRYKFNPKCLVIHGTGDNPSSLAGLQLQIGDIAISLGTSDTLFGALNSPKPNLEGHIFCNSTHPKAYMALLCFKNGSLTREYVRDKYAGGSWEEFNRLLMKTPPGNSGRIGMFFLEPEITPPAQKAIYKFDQDGSPVMEFDDKDANVRAVVEGQFLSMFAHSRQLGVHVSRIIATGGASKNTAILQIMSDVFGAPVFVKGDISNSAALGAALRAYHGRLCHERGEFIPFDQLGDVTRRFEYRKATEPNLTAHKRYIEIMERYCQLESAYVKLL